MKKIGKAFGDMPGLADMFGGAAGAGGASARSAGGEEGDEGEEVESAFLQAAMEGDLAAVKKFVADGGAGTPSNGSLADRETPSIQEYFLSLR